MKSNPLGRLLVAVYPYLRSPRWILTTLTRSEGGELCSLSLRRILRSNYGVDVGPHTYGSLLIPGMADPKTSIGAYTSIGPGVRRIGAAHPIESLTMHPYWYNPALGRVGAESDVERTECAIGDDVWIGANVLILPGCRSIGRGAVVGAGSIVTHDVQPFSIAVGNPARVIGTRLDPITQGLLSHLDYGSLTPMELESALRTIASQGPPNV
jgi:acetyltransferase-like isoleucine patch superfamily enzyme